MTPPLRRSLEFNPRSGGRIGHQHWRDFCYRVNSKPEPLYEQLLRYTGVSRQRSRLRRLLAEDRGECRDSDLEQRLDELESIADAVPDRRQADLTALKTLGNDTRYEIVHILGATTEELCVCEIAPLVGVSDSAVSHALSDLTDAGLVTRRKDGTWRYYDTTERAEQLVAALGATRGGRK